MKRPFRLLGSTALTLVLACSGEPPAGALIGAGGAAQDGPSGGGGPGSDGSWRPPLSGLGGGSGTLIELGDAGGCPRTTCSELGWECGYTVDRCGDVVDCAEEGLTCGAGQACVGGLDGPTQCVAGSDAACELCEAVADCSGAPQPTRLSGRVITPGRDDGNVENQVGVPNAVVYILRTGRAEDLPEIATGVPVDGQSCDRCEDQDLGPLLAGAVTDAEGNFVLEGNVPVGAEFLLVVKAGKFRRATTYTLPAAAACQTTALPTEMPANPTRLARHRADGLAVHLPRIGISTGRIDAIECVFEKVGISAEEFGNFGSDASVHLYQGSAVGDAPQGAVIAGGSPEDEQLYGSLARLASYDMIVSDCEGTGWDGRTDGGTRTPFAERIAYGDNVREYVNRGGRLFASHLSASWLHQNGSAPYSSESPIDTGLASVASWEVGFGGNATQGTGVVSLVGERALVSPRIDDFASWLVNEGVTSPPEYRLTITDPRSLALSLGPYSEEFLYREDGNGRVQQFSFDTPYGAPDGASCGRVAYSGFHVAGLGAVSDAFATAVFPDHCRDAFANDGVLTNQEKVLLYMLFDLGACVGDAPIPPPCVPLECNSGGASRCGYMPDGCGAVLDCGACSRLPA